MKKVFVIIDQPERDLSSLMYIFSNLLKLDKYRIIFFSKDNLPNLELDYFKNSILICNYFRKSIFHYLSYLFYFKKTEIVIYDTEGVGGKDGYAILPQIIKLKNYLNMINEYWLWGINLEKKLRKNLKFKNFYSVGCPRLDPSYLKLFKKKMEKNILVTTNFPTLNPKYSKGVRHEFKEIKKLDDNANIKVIQELENQRNLFVKYLKKTIKIFKSEKFIIRPHPFENLDFWISEFRNYKNVNIKNDIDIFSELKNSKIVIHRNDTCAIEAKFINIKSLSMNWILGKNDFKIPIYVSKRSKNFEEFKKNILLLLKNKKYKSNIQKIQKFYINPKKRNTITNVNHRIMNIKTKKREFTLDKIFLLIRFFLSKISNFLNKKKSKKLINSGMIKKEINKLNLQNLKIQKNKNFFYEIKYK
jgi:surface carbohydrate biosynthesis protein